jgi:hypothetical protein
MSEFFDGYNLALEVDRSDTSHSFFKQEDPAAQRSNRLESNVSTKMVGLRDRIAHKRPESRAFRQAVFPFAFRSHL